MQTRQDALTKLNKLPSIPKPEGSKPGDDQKNVDAYCDALLALINADSRPERKSDTDRREYNRIILRKALLLFHPDRRILEKIPDITPENQNELFIKTFDYLQYHTENLSQNSQHSRLQQQSSDSHLKKRIDNPDIYPAARGSASQSTMVSAELAQLEIALATMLASAQEWSEVSRKTNRENFGKNGPIKDGVSERGPFQVGLSTFESGMLVRGANPEKETLHLLFQINVDEIKNSQALEEMPILKKLLFSNVGFSRKNADETNKAGVTTILLALDKDVLSNVEKLKKIRDAANELTSEYLIKIKNANTSPKLATEKQTKSEKRFFGRLFSRGQHQEPAPPEKEKKLKIKGPGEK